MSLTSAIENDNLPLLENLIALGFPLSQIIQTARAGNDPCLLTASSAISGLIDQVVELGNSDPLSHDDQGRTALMKAASRGWTTSLYGMKSRIADPNLRDNAGNTALMYSASNGNAGGMAFLLSIGANPDLVNNRGQNAVDLLQVSPHGDKEYKLRLLHEGPTYNTYIRETGGKDLLYTITPKTRQYHFTDEGLRWFGFERYKLSRMPFEVFQWLVVEDPRLIQIIDNPGLTHHPILLKEFLSLNETDQIAPDPIYAVYNINDRYKDLKPLMLLRPREQNVTYTPQGLAYYKMNPDKLTVYHMITWFVLNDPRLYRIPYIPCRPPEVIRELLQQVSYQRLKPHIKDLHVSLLPEYKGTYGRQLELINSINKLISPQLCPDQEKRKISLVLEAPGNELYEFHKIIDREPLETSEIIEGKNNAYLIHSDVAFLTIYNLLQKCNKLYYVILSEETQIGLSFISDELRRHAMVLIIDRDNQTIEIFDPNGINPGTRHVYWWVKILIRYLHAKSHGRYNFTRIISSDDIYCPQIHASISPEYNEIGQCSLWSYYYLWLRLNNPDVSRLYILNHMSSIKPDAMHQKIMKIANLIYG